MNLKNLKIILIPIALLVFLTPFWGPEARAQTSGTAARLTYAQVFTALQSLQSGRFPSNYRGTVQQKQARALNDLILEIRRMQLNRPLTDEIRILLLEAGATSTLIAAIQENSPRPEPKSTPEPAPTPQDFAYYQNRGDQAFDRGDMNLAVADYDKALEINNSALVQTFLNRGRALSQLGSIERARGDFDRVIALDPSNVRAYQARAEVLEKLKELGLAAADLKKVLEFEPGNAEARAQLDAIEKQLAQSARPDGPVPSTLPVLVSKAVPDYPDSARKQKIEGIVIVEVDIDEKGKVTSARAIEGPQALRKAAERAARRSTFTPATDGQKPIKSKDKIEFQFPPVAVSAESDKP